MPRAILKCAEEGPVKTEKNGGDYLDRTVTKSFFTVELAITFPELSFFTTVNVTV